MKKVYMLEVNCEYVGVYETKEKAILEGLSRYADWLERNGNADMYNQRELVEDLQKFIASGYIEDYIYISELPYYGSDSE